jgi:hypothetical protein
MVKLVVVGGRPVGKVEVAKAALSELLKCWPAAKRIANTPIIIIGVPLLGIMAA